MSALPNALITPAEYLERERKAQFKSEYLNGEVLAMPGACEPHVVIAGNLNFEIRSRLRNDQCRVYGSDLRVRVNPKDDYMYAYPDLSVACEHPRFEDDQFDTLLNPAFLVEILSESTELYDRRVKAKLYRQLDSLNAYMLVSQGSPHVELYTRQSDGQWLFTEAYGLDSSIQVTSLQATLPLKEIYRHVEFAKRA